MIQFFIDTIDQLDLALDQLAAKDRSLDRFALILVDNIVELTLHQNAYDQAIKNKIWSSNRDEKTSSSIEHALREKFEDKVKLARDIGLLSQEYSDSIKYCHSFRNTAYHQGIRHEGILHSLTIFYFMMACQILLNYSPLAWSWDTNIVFPHRAIKYLGNIDPSEIEENVSSAFKRLHEVGSSMYTNLIGDLHDDMAP